jgi:hypothetical protein
VGVGDLGYKVDPKEESIIVATYVDRPVVRLEHDNCVINRGMTAITSCPEAPPTTCLVFGESFALGLLTVLSASFRRLVFTLTPTLDYDLVWRERPDIVIGVQNERFLMVIPYDGGAPTAPDLEREKREKGLIRENLIPYWGPPLNET